MQIKHVLLAVAYTHEPGICTKVNWSWGNVSTWKTKTKEEKNKEQTKMSHAES